MSNRLPLEGIRVVELSSYVAVPVVGRILADWGAEVVKVEDTRGDLWRFIGFNYGVPIEDEYNPCYAVPNANKKNVSINLKSENGKAVMNKLIETADVFLTNVRPGSLKKLGLDYETMKTIKEDIIYADFTGYGSEGPEAKRPGFDIAAYWCRSGALTDWVSEGDKPLKPTGGFGDASTSAFLSSAILAAYIDRLKTGEGTHLTTSLLGVGIWYNFFGEIIAETSQLPENFDKSPTPFINHYETKDGDWIMLVGPTWELHAPKIMDIAGVEKEKYMDQAEVLGNDDLRNELILAVREGFKQKTTEELHNELDAADVVHEKVVKLEDVYNDEQARANKYIVDVEFPNGKTRPLANPPVRFSNYDVTESYKVPYILGEDNEYLLKDLGYSDEEIANLVDGKSIK